jgi:hypothetical protein
VKVINLKTQEPPQRLHKITVMGVNANTKNKQAVQHTEFDGKSNDDMVNIQVQASSCQISAYQCWAIPLFITELVQVLNSTFDYQIS